MSWVQNQNPGGGVQGGRASWRRASHRPPKAPMDLAALWGGAWQQRAEVQRSWAAYYARDRHIGLCRPCALKHPHATCAHSNVVGAASFALGGVASACTPDGLATYVCYNSVLQCVYMLLVASASTWHRQVLKASFEHPSGA